VRFELDRALLDARVRDVPDFPTPGVVFKDVTPLLLDPVTLSTVVDALVVAFGRGTVDKVVGIESRGFIFAAPVAYHIGAGFVPARKAGKLPAATASRTYDLEYGTATLEMHTDAIEPGDRVLIVDDVLATGGTARATAELVEELGGEVVGLGFLIELTFLDGASKLGGREHVSLLTY
jgi:adenine phosphoribosyltransferase